MEGEAPKAVFDCFLTRGCPGKITVPLEVKREGVETTVGLKHSIHYGLVCSSCGEKASVEGFRAYPFKE